MCNEEPNIKREAVYTVKETCYILNISKGTLADRRKKGLITPLNPNCPHRFRYTGDAIRKLWRLENLMPI